LTAALFPAASSSSSSSIAAARTSGTLQKQSCSLVSMGDSTGPVDEQVEAIARGARLRRANYQERAHILSAVFRGLDQWDTLVATMRACESSEAGRQRVAELLGLDRQQASAVTGITMAMLTQQHHRLMVEDYDTAVASIAELDSVVDSPERLRDLVGTERGSYLARYGAE
jgi:DNA gyrase subunit A